MTYKYKIGQSVVTNDNQKMVDGLHHLSGKVEEIKEFAVDGLMYLIRFNTNQKLHMPFNRPMEVCWLPFECLN